MVSGVSAHDHLVPLSLGCGEAEHHGGKWSCLPHGNQEAERNKERAQGHTPRSLFSSTRPHF
jgi:hypothetical protein